MGHRSISAFLWGAGGTGARIAIQVVSQIVLARLLGPEQFGLFATGLVVVFFTNLIADAGLAYGLVQRKSVGEDDVRFIFTWQMMLAVAVSVSLYLGAPWIAQGFGDERMSDVVRWLSVAAIITSAGATSTALLRREMDFKTINIAGVAAYAVSFVGIGIPMAIAGFEVYALITAFLMQAVIISAICYWKMRHSVRPLLVHPDARGITGFGATVFGTNLVNWVMSSLDRAIVSAYLGVTSAGLYATVHNLINTPAQAALATLQPVFYAASAQVQGNHEQLRNGLRAMFSAICLFAMPVFVAISIVAETFILALYGTKWAGGEVVLGPLALAVPAMLLMGMSTPVLWTAGYPRREFQLQLPLAIVWALSCVAVAQLGSLALVSWVVFAMFVLRAGILIYATLLAVELPASALLPLFRPGVIVSGLVAVAAFATDRGLAIFAAGPHVKLIAVIATCAIAMIAGLRLVRGDLPPDLQRLLAKVGDRLPQGTLRSAFDLLLKA